MKLKSHPNESNNHLLIGRRLLRRARRISIAVGFLTITGLCNLGQLVAATDGPPGCTVATLRGRYLAAAAGMLYPPAFGVTEPTPAADAAIQMINGDGTGTDTVTLRVGGVIVLENAVFPTRYTVNADCTGTKTVLGGPRPKYGIFVAPDGSEFGSIATDSGNYVSGIDYRSSRRGGTPGYGGGGCTLATLKGRYPFAAAGMLYPPAFGVTEPTPAADAGYQLINGDGTGTDTVTLRVGGVIVLENAVFPTIYTVNADCTGTKTVLGGPRPKYGIFVALDGSEFASIATDPGNYVSNVDRRVSNK